MRKYDLHSITEDSILIYLFSDTCVSTNLCPMSSPTLSHTHVHKQRGSLVSIGAHIDIYL